MKREEIWQLLKQLADLTSEIPFSYVAQQTALKILSKPGIGTELRTLLFEKEKENNRCGHWGSDELTPPGCKGCGDCK